MLINQKENIRNWAKNERFQLNTSQLANLLIFNIQGLEEYKNAKIVMLYHPLKNEFDLLPLLNDNKLFCFPKIIGGEIVPFTAGEHYSKGAFGISEPIDTKEIDKNIIDLIIVPALAVDKNGNRIGYGKGYYDRFLNNINREKTTIISALPQKLFIEKIDTENQDIPIDYLITENETYKF